MEFDNFPMCQFTIDFQSVRWKCWFINFLLHFLLKSTIKIKTIFACGVGGELPTFGVVRDHSYFYTKEAPWNYI